MIQNCAIYNCNKQIKLNKNRTLIKISTSSKLSRFVVKRDQESQNAYPLLPGLKNSIQTGRLDIYFYKHLLKHAFEHTYSPNKASK